ncbi:hypothetical protein, variant 1 [Aphanomyces invadans]|uniref:START domain-containing protein n=1 Tax=Aphanomyces invadans TaxID=157072 RepID=A0A024TFS5_9STRA|nr:hypothetical protein, variant 1 [Aphanomyces invadans]ETV92421.1 hypothetical protein, variant 1 [Aphanomyces invadans]|eukprot:XP_008878973.1 hypothetical protein, variant 1 [Aphanomyces invadans]
MDDTNRVGDDTDLALLDEFLRDDGSLCEENFLPHAQPPPPPSDAVIAASVDRLWADSDEMAPPPPATCNDRVSTPKRGKRNRVYMKDELEYLRAKHDELVAQVAAIKQAAVPRQSVWARRAKDQAEEAQRVLQENARLKEALDEQLKMVDALHRIFSKKPRLAVFPSSSGDFAEWKAATLGSTGRRRALHRLLDHQFAAMESQWIRNDVYAATALASPGSPVKKGYVRSGTFLVVHFVQCSTWDAPFTRVGDVLWDMVSVKVKIEFANQYVSERVEAFDDDTMYSRFSATLPQPYLPAVDGRLASKRFREPNRVVIVYRSIVEDVLLPHDPRHLQDNQSGWVLIEPWGDNRTKLSILTCQTPPLAPSLSIEAGAMSEYMLGMFAQNTIMFDNAIAAALARRPPLAATS